MFKNLKLQLNWVLGLFALLIASSILFTYFTLTSQESDALVINLAGKQRMLSQKILKEASLAAHQVIKVSELDVTVSLFEKTLNGLEFGDTDLKLPKAENREFIQSLQTIKPIWAEYKAACYLVVETPTATPEERVVLADAQTKSVILLKELNNSVSLYEVSSSGTTQNLILFITIIGIVFAIVLAGIKTAIEKFVLKPINSLGKAAERIASSDLDFTLSVKKEDEISIVRKSMNVMIQNLKSSKQALLMEKAGVEEKVRLGVQAAEQKEKHLSDSTKTLLEAMEVFAKGDLTVQLPVKGDDDIAKLFHGFNEVVQKNGELLTQVTDAIFAAASASEQISSTAEEMAAGSVEQETQAESVLGNIDLMSESLSTIASDTELAAGKVQVAEKTAISSGQTVKETINGIKEIAEVVTSAAATIEELGKSSAQIGDIVQVIEDIADQTNLLALNAAIEAARAGEQGRGFAVVADEVRKLAERTTKATKEIGTMIKSVQKDSENAVVSIKSGQSKVERGIVLAASANDSLDSIISSTRDVTEQVNRIAKAGKEQQDTSQMILNSIKDMANVSRETAVAIQQMAGAADDLNKLTLKLQHFTKNFRLAELSTTPSRDNFRKLAR